MACRTDLAVAKTRRKRCEACPYLSAVVIERRVEPCAGSLHTLAICGQLPAMSISSSVPGLLWALFWILVAIVLVLLAALLVHHFGGFSLAFHIGYFHFQLGVR